MDGMLFIEGMESVTGIFVLAIPGILFITLSLIKSIVVEYWILYLYQIKVYLSRKCIRSRQNPALHALEVSCF
jgi:hypothetical protein